jgi:RNA-directed DNA polymerase
MDEQPALSDDLLEHILSAENLHRAWKRVRANKGAPGVDGMAIDAFPDWAKANWAEVKSALFSGAYQAAPVRRVEIPKPNGGVRLLGIPTVLDRLIQQAIAQCLMPLFDPGFSPHSYGFRPGRNAQQAVHQIQHDIAQNRRHAVDIDLSKFFDRVNHDLLMTRLGRKVQDKRVLKLIQGYLRAGVLMDGRIEASQQGVPQGGPLSPLLANILLDPLDKELERRGHCFARYADDIIIVLGSQRAGERVLRSLTRYLEKGLRLVVNTDKSRVVKVSDSQFLGFTFRGGRIHWHAKVLEAFKQRVRRLTNRNWGVSMRYQLYKLSQYLRGWINYFGTASGYQRCIDLDHWIRRRIRMAYWRQWRKPRTKVQNLIKRGVSIQAAVACGLTSKGPWRSSKTPGIQQALSNAYLKAEGLVSLQEGWIKLHYGK